LGGLASTAQHACGESSLLDLTAKHWTTPAEPERLIHTIFEGTSEIQQLVISRAISGLRIE
jgi:alkylation response protein AidB-like acyl-CoA dehydrogenase